MSKLRRKDVEHVASLAKLQLTKKEIEKFQKQLSQVISYVDELNEVNTSHVELTSQTTELENVYRNDVTEIKDLLTQDETLSGTDETYKGYFKVASILEEK